MVITTELALRIRERGLRLPAEGQYEDALVGDIAKLQNKLFDDAERLDKVLQSLAVPE